MAEKRFSKTAEAVKNLLEFSVRTELAHIPVLENGSIVRSGTHGSLIGEQGGIRNCGRCPRINAPESILGLRVYEVTSILPRTGSVHAAAEINKTSPLLGITAPVLLSNFILSPLYFLCKTAIM